MSEHAIHLESQIMGFAETDSSGAWVKLQIHHDDLAYFRGRKKALVDVAMLFRDDAGNVTDPESPQTVVETTDQQAERRDAEASQCTAAAKSKGPHSAWWQSAFKTGMFWDTNPDLFVALAGTDHDRDWQSFCRRQPCPISGAFDCTTNNLNVYAHILRADARTSGGKGEGSNKPIYSGIPMQQQFHTLQHSQGWDAVYAEYLRAHPRAKCRFDTGVEWAMTVRSKLLAEWCKIKLCALFEVDSRSQIEPKQFVDWCLANNVRVPSSVKV